MSLKRCYTVTLSCLQLFFSSCILKKKQKRGIMSLFHHPFLPVSPHFSYQLFTLVSLLIAIPPASDFSIIFFLYLCGVFSPPISLKKKSLYFFLIKHFFSEGDSRFILHKCIAQIFIISHSVRVEMDLLNLYVPLNGCFSSANLFFSFLFLPSGSVDL